MRSYHLWTIGCQMNTADSERLGSALEHLGLVPVEKPGDADVVVLNSCVVRQSAEEKVVGTLTSWQPIKKKNPDQVFALMGCMVGPDTSQLQRQFPHVDLFMRPQQFAPLLEMVGQRLDLDWEECLDSLTPNRPGPTCFVPIIHGCDLMCTFCIIPYRRGRQVSRPVDEVAREVELLSARGVKEVTLLGQTVDAYGHDLADKPDLADLLTRLNDIDGLERIRFLTSHPSFMSDRIIDSVASLPKVCEHINLPVQSGDDNVLTRMRRPYTSGEYLAVINRIKDALPHVSLSTDVIVGFPGETDEEYQRSLDLVAQVRFDKVHIAAYSPRPGTIAHKTLADDIGLEAKTERRVGLENLQEKILTEVNAKLVGREEEILVEGQLRGKWQGRTRSNKLVYFQHQDDYLGQLVRVKITHSTPWSLQASLAAA
ncbi:MAG TPA: tRNA (N6-isopentenyl adenosine(37)-C2)-methylthiotransferase MiaB [Dehalococcoidia bacterium]|nr:tRNA (N6-isopentenyl adenosine(37)-C2)-methylthiotransferase MiaB [Dehalococcoidia bacterium]